MRLSGKGGLVSKLVALSTCAAQAAFTVLIAGCEKPTEPVETIRPSYLTTNAPVAIPFEVTFDDVNPCTGLIHTVTISGTTFVQTIDGRVIARSERTITTSPTGFIGHGTDSFVANGQVMMFRLTDILTNASGDRIRALFVQVLDLSTGTVRVEEGGVKCVVG